MEGWGDRDYYIVLPDGYAGGDATPLLVDFHGGGGSKISEAASSCPEGDLDDPKCLHAFAREKGFALVYPNGTGASGWKQNLRSWNAGGGNPDDEFRCVSTPAGEDGVDDERYLRELLDDVDDDGTTTTRLSYPDCPLEHLRVDGGGHVWPQGHQYLSAKRVGPAWQDWGNEVIWDFLSSHSR